MSDEGAQKDAETERKRLLAEERKRDRELAEAEAKRVKEQQGNAS